MAPTPIMENTERPAAAMILAAGRGERMRPLTDRVPKPLLRVGGQTLIERHIERLARAGIRHLVVNLCHLGEQIEAFVGDGARWGVSVAYTHEPEGALETGGGILNALPLLGEGCFLVVNGDVWVDVDFAALRCPAGSLAHLVLVDNPDHHPDGDFDLANGVVALSGGRRLTFSGVGLFRPGFFAGCRPGRFPLRPLLRKAVPAGRVTGEHHRGGWSDVGTPARLSALDARLGAAG